MPTDEELKAAVLILRVMSKGYGKLSENDISYQIKNINQYINSFDLHSALNGLSAEGFLTKIQATGRDGKPAILYQITNAGLSRYRELEQHSVSRRQS